MIQIFVMNNMSRPIYAYAPSFVDIESENEFATTTYFILENLLTSILEYEYETLLQIIIYKTYCIELPLSLVPTFKYM